MVSNSKILTVSYGTFSCTLEGFDDSFDTMKAIAEYFRDLAADDRYFGAEPAAPDAEMLARIAEREISRRVEAHDTNGKIHLRAGTAALPAADPIADQTTADQTAANETAEWAAPTPHATAEPVSQSAPPSASAPAPRTNHTSSESMADKLRRIRAVAAPSISTFPGSGFDEDDNTQDFLAGAAIQPQEIQSGMNQPAEDAADDVPSEASRDSDEADVLPDPQPETAEDAAADPATDTAEPTSEVTLETAQDDVVAAETETADDSDDAVPEITDEVDDNDDDDILTRLNADAGAVPDLTADASETDASEEEASEAEQSDDLDAFLRDASLGAQASDDADDYDDEADDEYGAGDDTLSQLLADALDGGAAGNETSKVESAPENDVQAQDTADANASEIDEADAAPSDERPLAARVIKMKRSDLDAALAGENLQEVIEATDAPSDLSDEAEADLQRELAEVEAELHQTRAPETITADVTMSPSSIEDSDCEAETTAITPDEAPDVTPETDGTDEKSDHENDAPRAKHLDAPASDAQAARIFDEADTQLEEPESNQRRSAIQHLRAAVAATKAERRAGGAMQVDVDDQPYRNDLQSAVRPRRPQPVSTSMTPRPGATLASRPAPLKLVAEQRIDSPSDAVQPVRPRRITRADLVPARPEQSARTDGANPSSGAQNAQGSASFADFAEQKGASSLTEMLEAAAAYLADVEGTPQFSRPMLMQKLREAQDEDFSREDGLRSFGQLLRQGKLQKLKGGRFAVTSVTEFRQSA
ncbi:hypothetical protein [Roseovarius arcticus]|uniref:hypothetical protein n=1 Tax=Roseovarius arcticus TaxID=2547404 RepID=UPI001FE63A4C|nr:hypothetical protein [Roseovarius arcticus]